MKHFRRVVIVLEVEGTEKQAQAVQDAIGEAVNDDFLGPIVTRIVSNREIPHVNWTVKGEQFVEYDY